MSADLDRLAALVRGSARTVVLTGAGISTETPERPRPLAVAQPHQGALASSAAKPMSKRASTAMTPVARA